VLKAAGCPIHSRPLRMSGGLSRSDGDHRHSQGPSFVIILTGCPRDCTVVMAGAICISLPGVVTAASRCWARRRGATCY
jgi:hypothetical protein